jgi:hypothetical protein
MPRKINYEENIKKYKNFYETNINVSDGYIDDITRCRKSSVKLTFDEVIEYIFYNRNIFINKSALYQMEKYLVRLLINKNITKINNNLIDLYINLLSGSKNIYSVFNKETEFPTKEDLEKVFLINNLVG